MLRSNLQARCKAVSLSRSHASGLWERADAEEWAIAGRGKIGNGKNYFRKGIRGMAVGIPGRIALPDANGQSVYPPGVSFPEMIWHSPEPRHEPFLVRLPCRFPLASRVRRLAGAPDPLFFLFFVLWPSAFRCSSLFPRACKSIRKSSATAGAP